MRWIKLDGKKDPPANLNMLILFDDETWAEAFLKRIEFSSKGKTYVFTNSENEYEDVTHYMVIEPPKNNQ